MDCLRQPLNSTVSQLIGESVFRILLVALLAFSAWKGYEKYQSQRAAQQFQGIPQEIDISNNSSRRNRSIDITPKFQCDGRTHCSQMTSCEEATFFLKNCPGTKMDGNNDGVPCEQQWCKWKLQINPSGLTVRRSRPPYGGGWTQGVSIDHGRACFKAAKICSLLLFYKILISHTQLLFEIF